MAFAFEDGQTIVFAGASITDCGRRGPQAPFGGGYAKNIVDLVTIRYPERNITYFNEGIGGNTVVDLRNRWHDDVLIHNPDWLTVLIGINDLHRTLNGGDPVAPDRYEKNYREILSLTKEKCGSRLLLADPFYMSADFNTGSFRSKVLEFIPEYIAVVKKLAKEFDAIHVPLHDQFQVQLRHRAADVFCGEPVHPNATGHLLIAVNILDALGW